MHMYNSLDPEQLDGIDRLYETDETLFIAPQGYGKTVVAATAMKELLDEGVLNRVLVVAPVKVATMAWATEGPDWEHLAQFWATSVGIACGTEEERINVILNPRHKVIVINYENIDWLFDYFPQHNFDGLLLDEITKLKTCSGEAHKAIRRNFKRFSWRAGMTATPGIETMVDIFGQVVLLDGGKALGRNKDKFRRYYFYPTDFEQRNWEMHPHRADELRTALKSILFRASSKNSYEGQVIEEIKLVTLPLAARAMYRTMESDSVITVISGPPMDTKAFAKIVAPNAAVKTEKLHQICCGRIYDESGRAHYLHGEKMSALLELRQSIDGPVMIAYQYKYELIALENIFLRARVLTGTNPIQAKKLQDDWNAGKLSELLVHPKSASHGLNLQYGPCNTLICLSPIWSADQWDQLMKRLARRGQKSDILRRISLVAKGTMEMDMVTRTGEKPQQESKFFELWDAKQ